MAYFPWVTISKVHTENHVNNVQFMFLLTFYLYITDHVNKFCPCGFLCTSFLIFSRFSALGIGSWLVGLLSMTTSGLMEETLRTILFSTQDTGLGRESTLEQLIVGEDTDMGHSVDFRVEIQFNSLNEYSEGSGELSGDSRYHSVWMWVCGRWISPHSLHIAGAQVKLRKAEAKTLTSVCWSKSFWALSYGCDV